MSVARGWSYDISGSEVRLSAIRGWVLRDGVQVAVGKPWVKLPIFWHCDAKHRAGAVVLLRDAGVADPDAMLNEIHRVSFS